jgi:hypothetical protein
LSLYHPAVFKEVSDKDDSSYESASIFKSLLSKSESSTIFKDITPVKQKYCNHQRSSSSKLPQSESSQPIFIHSEYYEKQKQKLLQSDASTPAQHTLCCNLSIFAKSIKKDYRVMKDMLCGTFHFSLKTPH